MLFTFHQKHSDNFNVTQIIWAEATGLRIKPRIHRHKIRYEAWDRATKNCIISNDNALGRYIDFISLVRNWKKKEKINWRNMQLCSRPERQGRGMRQCAHYQISHCSTGSLQSRPTSRHWQSQPGSLALSTWIWRHCQWSHSHGICPLQSADLSLKDLENKSTSTFKNEQTNDLVNYKALGKWLKCW